MATLVLPVLSDLRVQVWGQQDQLAPWDQAEMMELLVRQVVMVLSERPDQAVTMELLDQQAQRGLSVLRVLAWDQRGQQDLSDRAELMELPVRQEVMEQSGPPDPVATMAPLDQQVQQDQQALTDQQLPVLQEIQVPQDRLELQVLMGYQLQDQQGRQEQQG